MKITITGTTREGKTTLAFFIAKILEENSFDDITIRDEDCSSTFATGRMLKNLASKIAAISDREIVIETVNVLEDKDVITKQKLEANHFLHYIGSPKTQYARELYTGLYVTYDTKEKLFRFCGAQLPHKSLEEIITMAKAMGADW